MFTKTSDCLQIGNLRKGSIERKTIPSVQFDCQTEQGSCSILILGLAYSSPASRLLMEAMYLTAIGQTTEEELNNLCLNVLPNIKTNDSELLNVLHQIREMRVDDYQGEISLQVSTETLSNLFQLLESEGNLSFCTDIAIPNGRLVSSWDIINYDYLASIYDDQLEVILSNISNNDEYLGTNRRFYYPEDCFLERGPLFLSYINSMSGGAYDSYETLKHAYRVNDHFRDNPDFFNKTHCQCGGELVVRKNKGEYTLMSCINPYCYEKMAFALADFARAMGIDGLGAVTFLTLTRQLALRNLELNGSSKLTYRMLLKDENERYFGDATGALWLDFIDAIRQYKGTVKDLISNMNLPYISSDASKILTTELLQKKDLTPIDLRNACNRQGKYDLKFMLNIWLNLDDIRFVILELAESINLEVVEEYLIYITKGVRLQLDDGRVISYTKKQFENLINDTLAKGGENSMRVKVHGSLTHKCHALIADQDRNTGSCRTAENYGIPILTSREFILHLSGGGE